jgi:hypothetical protein
VRMGVCQDIQDRNPYVRKEDDIQGSVEMAKNEIIYI